MKTLKSLLVIIILCIIFISCEKDDDNSSVICDQNVIISADQYSNAPNDYLKINYIRIIGDYLIINFSSSGCSGDTWKIKLIDSSSILESYPPQRTLRLSLKNEELCEAFITKELSFNIKDLQVDGNKVYLNIKNSGDQILYEY